jgi:hypothetical protein
MREATFEGLRQEPSEGVSDMQGRHLLTALATASLIVGAQALAQGRGGGHGGGHGQGGVGVGVGSTTRGNVGAGIDRNRMNTDVGVRTRTDARVDARGPERANARARARANDRSVLATGRVSPDLSLLRTGLMVRDSTGASLGTIARINRSGDGTIRNVLVRNRNGRSRTIPVAPNSLSIDGDIVTTTILGLN